MGLCSLMTLDVIPEQGKDRFRAALGRSLWPWHGAFSVCRPDSHAASNVGHEFCGCCKAPGGWVRGNVVGGGREDEEICCGIPVSVALAARPHLQPASSPACCSQETDGALERTVAFKRKNVSFMPPFY